MAKLSTPDFSNVSTGGLNKQLLLYSPVFPVNEAPKLQRGRHFCTFHKRSICMYILVSVPVSWGWMTPPPPKLPSHSTLGVNDSQSLYPRGQWLPSRSTLGRSDSPQDRMTPRSKLPFEQCYCYRNIIMFTASIICQKENPIYSATSRKRSERLWQKPLKSLHTLTTVPNLRCFSAQTYAFNPLTPKFISWKQPFPGIEHVAHFPMSPLTLRPLHGGQTSQGKCARVAPLLIPIPESHGGVAGVPEMEIRPRIE